MRVDRLFWLPFVQDRISVARHAYAPATASVKATGPWKQRNQHIERIAAIGRQAWQKETGYRQQARVEGTFLRFKRVLGGSLRAKGFEAQQREAMVGCTVLNKMLALGEAQSSPVTE